MRRSLFHLVAAILALCLAVPLPPLLRAADTQPHGGTAPIPPSNLQGPFEITWITPRFRAGHFWGDLVFSADGKRLLVAIESQAQVWDTATWKPVGPRLDYGDWTRGVSFDDAGKRVLVIRNVVAMNEEGGLRKFEEIDAEWRVWDVETGKAVGPLIRHKKRVLKIFPAHSARMSPDGQFVAVTIGQSVEVWHVDTGEKRHSFDHRINAYLERFSADGKSLITYSEGKAYIWNLESGALRAANAPFDHWTTYANGRGLIETGFGFRVIDLTTGHDVMKKDDFGKYEVHHVHISAGGNRVAVEKNWSSTEIWDLDSRKRVATIPTYSVMAMDAKGSLLMTCVGDLAKGEDAFDSIVWDAESGRKLRDLGGFVDMATFSRDGNQLAILQLTGNDRVVRVLRADPAKKGAERWMVEGK